eukprot:Gb_34560 [translate_table: standard]
MDNKTARVHYTMQRKMKELPKSYQLQTDKEKRLLNHVSQFQKRFMQLYPQRRPLMMVVENECGVEKFLCTTIRPSHMDYIELYNWEGCAEFLANFLTYEMLEESTRFPLYIPSPQSVLEYCMVSSLFPSLPSSFFVVARAISNILSKHPHCWSYSHAGQNKKPRVICRHADWQRGDCFDFSIVLVSLLTGAGYEAFCVVGYAPPFITSNDQEDNKYVKESPPVFNSEHLVCEKEARDKIVRTFVQEFRNNYDRELQFGQNEEEDSLLTFCSTKCMNEATEEESCSLEQNISQDSESLTCAEKENLGFPSNKQNAVLDVNDSLYKNRLHCWVLLGKGKRDEPESFFLEPSTGCRYPILQSPYYAIEYIWNQHNVWINMQPNPERSGLSEISLDLKDNSRWERVLDSLYSSGYVQDKNHTSVPITETSSSFSGQFTGKGPESTTSGACEIEENHSVAGKETEFLSPKSDTEKHVMKIPTSPKNKLPEKASHEEDKPKGYMDPHHWLLPISWVPKLQISVESFVTRWDGLIEKLLIYADEEHSILLECHDYFQRRKDCLRKRIFYLMENKVHFCYYTEDRIRHCCLSMSQTRIASYKPVI